MRPEAEFTIKQLQAELEKTLLPEGEGCSVEELSEATGLHRGTISQYLTKLVKQGQVEVARRRGKDVIGRTRWTPIYRLRAVQDQQSIPGQES